MINRLRIAVYLSLFALVGCSQAYYGVLEKVGIQKREILRDRVLDTRETQKETAEDFKSALERFQAVAPFDGGKLEQKYSALSRTVERLEERKREVRSRIDSVDDVAQALFREWKGELRQFSNENLRRKSQEQLKETEDRYSELKLAFERAYQRIQPALTPLQDQVLFLKHNLNAKAVASLKNEQEKISSEVAELVAEIDRAVRESEQFIKSLG